jgi:hypothetical protein
MTNGTRCMPDRFNGSDEVGFSGALALPGCLYEWYVSAFAGE